MKPLNEEEDGRKEIGDGISVTQTKEEFKEYMDLYHCIQRIDEEVY